MATAVEPLRSAQRHPADYRDGIEHAEVAGVLSELPDSHPARIAYCAAAREASDTIVVMHLVHDQPELVTLLTEVYLARYPQVASALGLEV